MVLASSLQVGAVALADDRLDGLAPDLRGYAEMRDIADAPTRLQARSTELHQPA